MTLAAEAVRALADNALQRYEQVYSAEHLTWRDFADDARADLAALAAAGMLNVYLARELARTTA